MEEDDLPVSEVAAESGSLPLSLPSPVNFLPQAVRSSTSQAPVLGKTQAKKRLLAFSMTKQGGGAGVSFNLTKKTAINKETAKGFSDEKDENKKKPPKKGYYILFKLHSRCFLVVLCYSLQEIKIYIDL